MIDFFYLIGDFFLNIFKLLNGTIIDGGDTYNMTTSLGGLLFVCIVLGFAVNIFWKGARS